MRKEGAGGEAGRLAGGGWDLGRGGRSRSGAKCSARYISGCMFGFMLGGSAGLRVRGALGRGGALRCGVKSPGRKGFWCTPGRSAGLRGRGTFSTSGGGHAGSRGMEYMPGGGRGARNGAEETSGGGHGAVLRLGALADAEDTSGRGHGVELRYCIA